MYRTVSNGAGAMSNSFICTEPELYGVKSDCTTPTSITNDSAPFLKYKHMYTHTTVRAVAAYPHHCSTTMSPVRTHCSTKTRTDLLRTLPPLKVALRDGTKVKVQWPSTVPEGPLDLAGLVAKQYPEVGSRNEFDLLTTEGLDDFSVTLAASAAACLSAASSTTKWACASCTSPQAVASAKALSPAMRLASCSILRLAP